MMRKTVTITEEVFNSIKSTIGKMPPETGGILGAKKNQPIAYYYFDQHGKSSETEYIPDIASINEILEKEWMPNDILLTGIVHSHLAGVNYPSCGDLQYGERILRSLDLVDRFYLPIVQVTDFKLTMYEISLVDEKLLTQKCDITII